MAQQQPNLPGDLDQAEALLRRALGDSDDLLYEPLSLYGGSLRGLLVFVEGMVSRDLLQNFVLKPLMQLQAGDKLPAGLAEFGRQHTQVASQKVFPDAAAARERIFRGHSALLLDGYPGALLLHTEGWEKRAIEAPPSESGLRGPRDGFVEELNTNLARIRRRLSDQNLTVRSVRVGRRSQTRVALLYMADIAPQKLVGELTRRLKAIEFDAVLDSHQLRGLLVGASSPFPKMVSTERPDRVVSALLAGRAALVVDNTPFVLLAPATLIDTLWAPDDYYSTPAVAFLIRVARTAGLLVTLFLSPLYIGIELYNPGLARTDLALYLARERAGVPLNPALEIFFLELMMEMVHEATVRLPSKVGSAATIFGGLIVGQAAVEARLLSGVVVIVAAISAIGSFALPGQEIGQVWRVVKWGLILAATLLGVYGIFAASFILFAWLTSQDSFGIPYMAPVAPAIRSDLLQDSLWRKGWNRLTRRAQTYQAQDQQMAPAPPSDKYRDGGER